jgi:glycolate oxidase FAD binding subunit
MTFPTGCRPTPVTAYAWQTFCLDLEDDDTMEKAVAMVNGLSDRFSEKDGSLVVHTVPSPWKAQLNMWGEPGSAFPVMKRLKEKIDPLGMMNPGRFVGGL